ncbi:MAG: hypothetical protein JNM70_16220 [Anaerolineae bacterium]|nr:hypothetical protein [Anaerolineae bacterium]
MKSATATSSTWISRLGTPRVELLIRAIVFLMLCVVTYSVGYLKAVESNSFADTFWVVRNTVRAANEGHILMAYTPETPSRLLPLNQISSGYYDPGWPMAVSLIASVGRSLTGGNFHVDDTTIYGIVWGFTLLTGLVFLLPIVPLSVSIGGTIALTLSMTALLPGYNAFGSLWGSTHSVIVMAVFLGALGLAQRSWMSVLLYSAAIGLLVGVGQFIRHEATLIVYSSGAVMIGAAVFIALVLRYLIRDPMKWRATAGRFALRVVEGVIIVVAVVIAIPYGVRAIFAITFEQPYADTRIAMHGEGHSLYLSLGYVSNPYNISWRDNVASIHSELINPDTRIDSPNYHQVLRDEWLRIVWENPWLIVENVASKARTLQTMLLSLPVVADLFMWLPVIWVSMVAVTLIRPQPSGMLILTGYLALVLVAVSVPLLVFPTYNQAFQGVLLVSFISLPALIQSSIRTSETWSELPPHLLTRLRNIVVILAAGAIFLSISLGFVFIQIQRNAQQIKLADALNADPFEMIQELGFRYDSLFNSFTVGDQQAVVDHLKKLSDDRVWSIESEARGSVTYFRPELLVFTDRQVHVLVWLGEPGPDFEFTDQGSASSFLRVCADCESLPVFLANNPYRLTEDQIAKDIQAINDTDWYGHYRIMSFPLKFGTANAKFWCAGLQELASLNLEAYTYSLDTLASICFAANG